MLVDLAGCERATASSGKNPLRLEEAKAINLSLSALGNCMSALASQSQSAATSERSHVPYRDSKLTRLLQGCLGGGARTAVGECILCALGFAYLLTMLFRIDMSRSGDAGSRH